jgi:hypothetical protein
MPHGNITPAEGSRHFVTALRLAAGGLFGCVVLQLFLYFRPGAYGGPFLIEWQRYFWLALYYEVLGVWLLSLPFFAWWLLLYRRRVGASASWLHRAQGVILTLNLLLSQIDHEAMRFLGIRIGFSFAATYVRAGTVTDSLFYDAFRQDAGGPFLSFALLVLVPVLYGWWARRQIRQPRPGRSALWFTAAVALAIVPLAAPANGWRMATSQFRLRKVEPVVIALAVDFAQGFHDLDEPDDLARLAGDYQARWLGESADKAWRFPDPRRPYIREPTATASAGEIEPWNVILIQLETLRGLDVGHLNLVRQPSPTPYLDSLAMGGKAAVFTRVSSFAQPTINAMFAVHCSVTPHSSRYVTTFTQSGFYCLPEALRDRGYRAEMFNAGDTDWDGSTWWLTRWYDRLVRYPNAKEHVRGSRRRRARRPGRLVGRRRIRRRRGLGRRRARSRARRLGRRQRLRRHGLGPGKRGRAQRHEARNDQFATIHGRFFASRSIRIMSRPGALSAGRPLNGRLTTFRRQDRGGTSGRLCCGAGCDRGAPT